MSNDAFDFNVISKVSERGQYECHLSSLGEGFFLDSIKEVVDQTLENLKCGKKSFIIYGEPQSGKTEMMISLTFKLLDENHKTIIILVPDQLTLLNQNLLRFKKAGLSPSPKSYKEVIDNDFNVQDKTLVIICKKNYSDLTKLIEKLKDCGDKIIIDDEADYATPNSKINLKQVSKINSLTGELISQGSVYIGVTATPARLDLNNTHKNKTSAWVSFKPHPEYTGQDHFFPTKLSKKEYKINFLPPNHDSSDLEKALYSFFINVAYLNITSPEKGYSMIIHTSRRRIDHSEDKNDVTNIISNLSKRDGSEENKSLWEKIWNQAKDLYPGNEDQIANYIYNNIDRHEIKVLNSNRDKTLDSEAPNPFDPFTIIIGGDVISRGVTFERLLSMFFTRDVKTVFNQDTYIQRARMFGSRKRYIKNFELWIPTDLFSNWYNSFMMHRISLESIKFGSGPPVWIEGEGIRATNSGSIDRGSVIINKGEITSNLFDYDKSVETIISTGGSKIETLKEICSLVGDAFPLFIIDFMEKNWFNNGERISIKCSSAQNWGDDVDKENISRPRKFISGEEGVHQFLIVHNDNGKARLIYRPSSLNNKLRFLTNEKQIENSEPSE